jgi:hypothetical protein
VKPEYLSMYEDQHTISGELDHGQSGYLTEIPSDHKHPYAQVSGFAMCAS